MNKGEKMSNLSQLINILETIGVIDWMLFYIWPRTGS
jgi:hypothetical protein